MNKNEVSEVFYAFGHSNIRASHHSTLEITKDGHLSTTGDCIIAIASQKGMQDLGYEFIEALHRPNAKLTVTIEADACKERINACGSPNLPLTHQSDIVIRKSHHIDSRTLGINADKAARDLSTSLVEKLRNPGQKVRITFTVRT